MTAYATVADVKRVLRLTDDNPERDAQLAASLAAVESWADTFISIPPEGPGVFTVYDVNDDATIFLPTKDMVVTKIRIFRTPQSDNAVDLILGDSAFEVSGDGRIFLRPFRWYEPFEGAWADRLPRVISRVDVNFIATGVIPARVTEGIAFLTAGYWQTGPQVLLGLIGEKIGDYSYTLAKNDQGKLVESAWMNRGLSFLSADSSSSRVAVT